MTDVRLTALNPEDSKVYPVACNSSGELLTTKQGEDPIVSGDLTVQGSITAAGEVVVGTESIAVSNATANNVIRLNNNGSGVFTSTVEINTGFSAAAGLAVYGNRTGDSYASVVARQFESGGMNYVGRDSSGVTTFTVSDDGSATFAGAATFGDTVGVVDGNNRAYLNTGNIDIQNTTKNSTTAFNIQGGRGTVDVENVVTMTTAGSITAATQKAGFTAEGYLWCTTRRGDTVILDATSNGLATWADYTPPTRRDVIADKLDVIADKLDAKPGVSQDLPETQ